MPQPHGLLQIGLHAHALVRALRQEAHPPRQSRRCGPRKELVGLRALAVVAAGRLKQLERLVKDLLGGSVVGHRDATADCRRRRIDGSGNVRRKRRGSGRSHRAVVLLHVVFERVIKAVFFCAHFFCSFWTSLRKMVLGNATPKQTNDEHLAAADPPDGRPGPPHCKAQSALTRY